MFTKKKLITASCSTLILATSYIYAADSVTDASATTDAGLTTTSGDTAAVAGETPTTLTVGDVDAATDTTEAEVAGSDGIEDAADTESAQTGGANGITSVSRNLARNPDNAGLQNALEHLETNRERHEQHDLDRAGHIDTIDIEHPEELDHDSVTRPEVVERVAKVERPEKVEKIERVEKVEKAEKVERPERAERVERIERPESD
ncbi:MAG TPA: hypothetical protein VJM76_01045 [Gammaproteobacteria bacterium]|nr:hypothetical protein [Gammaproteobacteria bacterium]